ncbi:phosphoribosyltransferase [Candidatus Uhrbacteria bacterium]|nr:phosphoribosyltransferase [Candidatus Uhrbacteria bacterium]
MLASGDLTRTIPRPQIGPFYHRTDLAGSNGGKTYLAIDAEAVDLGKERISYLIESSIDPEFSLAICDTLDMPDVPTDDDEFCMAPEQMREYGAKFDRFEAGQDYAAAVLAKATLAVFPHREWGGYTTMECRIHQTRVDPTLRFVFAIMLRAGATFTEVAKKVIRPHVWMPPKTLHLWTDRAMDIMQTKPVDLSLRGRHLLIFDPLNASGRTAVEGIREVIAACKGGYHPESITVCFAHAHREGIERIHREFNATVFVGLLHKAMNKAKYLTGPGYGDGGGKGSQVRDRH